MLCWKPGSAKLPDLADWKIMEKELARKLKGQLTPGSGNQGIKGDVHTDLFVIEAKWRRSECGKGTFLTLEESWLTKIAKQAAERRKTPLLAICIANYDTYYLLPYDFWEQSGGRMDCIDVVPFDYTDHSQLRMYASQDHSYHRFLFSKAGAWIALPETDLMLLVELERRAREETDICQTQYTKPRRTRPEKTAAQIEREKQFKERQKAWRKQANKERRQKRKAERTTGT